MLQSSARHRRIGIGLVTLTTLCFAMLDTAAKWLVLALPVLQVVWLRFLTHSLFSLLIFGPSMGLKLVRWHYPRLQLLRGMMLATMTGLNFWALQYLQLAETGAMQFSVPILIAILSGWLLGERLDTRRWLAIATGFVGVLIIIRPGTQAFHPAILLSAGNAILYAFFNMLTRRLAEHEHPARIDAGVDASARSAQRSQAAAGADLHQGQPRLACRRHCEEAGLRKGPGPGRWPEGLARCRHAG